ncbi:hypothetical protein Tco_0621594, partial [Tanacetum coccineum]
RVLLAVGTSFMLQERALRAYHFEAKNLHLCRMLANESWQALLAIEAACST